MPVNRSSLLANPVNLDWWNAAWLAALALGAGLLLVAGTGVTGAALLAVIVMALPPSLGLVLARAPSDLKETILLLAWGICSCIAALLVAGVGGPLAVWLLSPLASAAAMAQPRRLALGAAICLASFGFTLLGGWVFLLPPSPGVVLTQALGAMALLTMCMAVGAGLVLLQRQLEQDRRRSANMEHQARQALAEQPHLLVSVNAGGLLTGTWGQVEGPLRETLSPRRRLSDVARPEDRANIDSAIASAFEAGRAVARFGIIGTNTLALELSLRRVSPTRAIGAISDVRCQIAREHALEAARAEAEAQNAGKSRFLANMSHELRTPLNAIMGFADIMQQRLFGPIPDRYGDYPELIHESGSHLLELINDVLDISKIEAERYELHYEDFDAKEALDAVLRLMRGQADRMGVVLRGKVPEHALSVKADRRALKQIMLNLVSNALKFTPKGGVVSIELSQVDEDLELRVVDTGDGISPADLERLGTPYEQAGDVAKRSSGTGLGLSLVRALSDLHGGSMRIESQVGQGTTVAVRLPVLLQDERGSAVGDAQEGQSGREVTDLNINPAHDVALK